MQDIERHLISVARRHRSRKEALEEIEPERDAAIRAAMEARLPRRRIMEITGLSRQRLDQIRRANSRR